jgi:hypothetical protein
MSRAIRQHLRSNIVGYVALFFALSTGSAVALSGSNTVFTDDIVNDEVRSVDVRNDALSGGGLTAADLRPNSVATSEVRNFSLNDEDIGQGTSNFQANIGNVPAQSCAYHEVTGINAQGDHLLLTPNFDTTAFDLDYGAQYSSVGGSAFIAVCNPTGADIDDALTSFNLIVIDAQ